eukprot:m.261312 g.261312  ORF g.261312 m.261312 type:complete len:53 (+) comp40444_c1_seq11:117-275(+)
MTDREVALANFLAATGSEDITDSIVTLERHNWILVVSHAQSRSRKSRSIAFP